MNLKQIIFISFLTIAFNSCQKEELLKDSVVDSTYKKQHTTELDHWINKHFTNPYNINVVYRWEKNNAQLGTYTYPPKPENVKPVLEAVLELAFNLYKKRSLGGNDFWKGKSPLNIYLYGGKNIDNNKFELITNKNTLGNQLYIYNVDAFNKTDRNSVYVLMRSVHHQLVNMFTEVKGYNRDEFLKISENDYVSSTDKIDIYGINTQYDLFKVHEYANKRGFFTIHSLLSAQDDFSEIASVFLTTQGVKLEKAKVIAKTPRVSNNPTEQEQYNKQAKKAHNNLVKKQKIVETFFSDKLGFSLKRAQILSLQKINNY